MPVVIEEVIGTVDPDTPAPGSPDEPEGGAGGEKPDPMLVRRELRLRARRAARLHAD